MARNQLISKQRTRRVIRAKAKVRGTGQKPRIAIFRSNEHISAQIIDDAKAKTLCSVHDRELPKITGTKKESRRMQKAYEAGKLLAKKAIAKKITAVVFDRHGSKYHGRIAAFAKGAREGGLTF